MTLKESIAKMNLGELTISQFPKIAMDRLQNGVESESLIILAGMNENDNTFEIKEYLDKTLQELKIKSYSKLDSAFILANYYINKTRNGEINAVECVSKIKNECWGNCESLINSNKFLYDGVQFHEIIGSWYEYIEIDEQPKWLKESEKTISEIKTEIENQLKVDIFNWQERFLNPITNKLK